MIVKKGGDSYGFRKLIVLFLLQLTITPIIFDSVYIKAAELLTIYKEIFLKSPIVYIPNLRFL